MHEIEHFRKRAGWTAYERPESKKYAVVPNQDVARHAHFSEYCRCGPNWLNDILVHRSFDGREKYENYDSSRSTG